MVTDKEKMRRPVLAALMFLALIIFPFGQLAVLPLPILLPARLLLLDLFIGLFVFIFFIFQLIGKNKLKINGLFLPGLFFLGLALLSLLVNLPSLGFNQGLIAGFYLFRLTAYLLFWLALINQKLFSSNDLICHLKTIGFFVCVFGLIQYFFWPDLTALKYLNWDDHYFRLTGLFLDPNFAGILLVLTFILFYFDKDKWFVSRTLSLPLLALSIALTYSRSAFISLFTVGLLAMLYYRKIKFFLIVVLFLAVAILFLPRSSGGEGVNLARTSTVNARLETVKEAVQLFKTRPFLGIGFNAYRYQRSEQSLKEVTNRAGGTTDNSFLFVLATTGLFGLIAFVFFSGKMFVFSLKQRKITLSLSLVALAVNGLFINSLFYPWVLFWLVVLLVVYGE